LVPVIATVVFPVPTVGEKLVIVGAVALPVKTVNGAALVAEPLGDVTETEPVVAPDGTVVTISVTVEEVTTADVPLNATALLLDVALNPVPTILTVVPIGPVSGVRPMIET